MSPSSPSSSSPHRVNGTKPHTVDQISGNCSLAIKQTFLNPGMVFATLDRDGKYRALGFAMETVFQTIIVTHISHSDAPAHWETSWRKPDSMVSQATEKDSTNQIPAQSGQSVESVTLICEVDVSPDMANNHHLLHGGCTAFLVDMCSSLSVVALTMMRRSIKSPSPAVQNHPAQFDMLSQSMNVVYHSPSQVGDRLRIVSTTMPMRELVSNVCVQTEIWSTTQHRLVASGVQNMMTMSSGSRL
ncbi:hypothetical protein FB446DRAFT_172303 [Lentinula raphanica]|nr:hypothetical protein FB446DRAFT_172303 [Lentinula raphanica]